MIIIKLKFQSRGSPKYEGAALVLNELNSGSELEFSFDVKNYELGAQTEHEFQYKQLIQKKSAHSLNY